jgi:hypothetical protein
MENKISEALKILIDLGVPKGQQNDRTALCLLALLDVKQDTHWADAKNPLIGITPMMEFAKDHYQRTYAPNTRESFRRLSIHQLVEAGIALYNPDRPDRPVNSPKAVYQISPIAFSIIRMYGTYGYAAALEDFKQKIGFLAEKYQKVREMNMIPVNIKSGKKIMLSPGDHSHLIKEIIENFASRFISDSILLYVGDTEKSGDILIRKHLKPSG